MQIRAKLSTAAFTGHWHANHLCVSALAPDQVSFFSLLFFHFEQKEKIKRTKSPQTIQTETQMHMANEGEGPFTSPHRRSPFQYY